MQLSGLQLLSSEGVVKTSSFGYINILKMSDLIESHESELLYNQMMIAVQLTKEIYGIDNENFSDIDLFFVKMENGEYITFKDDFIFDESFSIRDAFALLISKTFGVSIDEVMFLDDIHCITLLNNENFLITSDNYEELRDIILKSNMKQKIHPSKEVSEEYLDPSMKDRFKTYREHRRKRMKNNITTFMDMTTVVLERVGFDKKHIVFNMTMFEFLYYYDCSTSKEFYTNTYDQYLAGVDPKSLDLTHWSKKVKI